MRYCFYIVFMLFPIYVFSQPASSIDFGAGMGMSSYFGDINQEKLFYNSQMSFDGFMRYNFNNRYAIRANVLSAKLKANDRDFKNPYQENRRKFFIRSIFEIGVVGEVNFFPYQNPTEWGVSNGTIYALLGVAHAMSYTARKANNGASSIMFGVGYKRALKRRWAIEAEWAFRKLLKDDLDEISDPIKSGKTSSLFNNDWYYVLGIRISYNLWQQSGKCRTFERDTDL